MDCYSHVAIASSRVDSGFFISFATRLVLQSLAACSTKTMSASIIILNNNLKNHSELASKLNLLCKKVREEIDACVYTPEPGVLMTFLNLLSEHKINYETVYNNQINITHPNSNGT